MHLILYAKPGCHLCEGLEEKLRLIEAFPIELEIRDITTNKTWFEQYQYEIPVLFCTDQTQAKMIPRPSPRMSVAQLTKLLQKQQSALS